MCREQAKLGALEEAVVDASWDSYFQKLCLEKSIIWCLCSLIFLLCDGAARSLYYWKCLLVYKNLQNQYQCQGSYVSVIKCNQLINQPGPKFRTAYRYISLSPSSCRLGVIILICTPDLPPCRLPHLQGLSNVFPNT